MNDTPSFVPPSTLLKAYQKVLESAHGSLEKREALAALQSLTGRSVSALRRHFRMIKRHEIDADGLPRMKHPGPARGFDAGNYSAQKRRLLLILEEHKGMTIAEAARLAGLHQSTASRYIKHLCESQTLASELAAAQIYDGCGSS